MRFLILALSLLTATWAAPPSHRHEPAIAHGETLNEASANVRRLLHEVPYGSIATVFPHHEAAVGEWRRAGDPFAMLEYHAPCVDLPSLTFLLLPISLSVRNIIGSSSGAVSYMVRDEVRLAKRDATQQRPFGLKGKDRGMMDHARVSLMGNMTLLPSASFPRSELDRLASCYTSYHPDAAAWLPDADDSPHASVWARFDVEGVYYVGGFGDEHYIGEIPVDMLRE